MIKNDQWTRDSLGHSLHLFLKGSHVQLN